MSEQNDQIIETIDEDGNKVSFEVIDFITVDDIEYALLIPQDAEEDEEGEKEVLVARSKKNGDEYTFELIDNDEEFEKVAQYISEIEDELEDE